MSRYKSLEDYLQSHPLDVDGLLDDGWGEHFSVKGRIVDAAVLFADMGAFSSRSSTLCPIETLILVQNFFAWISAEGLRQSGNIGGIVDKYIGDEVMVVFSKDFGSDDPLADAIDAARWMLENDVLGFYPHIGISFGQVVVGYVGTPLKYNCSVYGSPVTLAQRCCQVDDPEGRIVFPADVWGNRKLEEVLTKRKMTPPDGDAFEVDVPWKLLPPRKVLIKGEVQLEILVIGSTDMSLRLHSQTVEQRAKRAFEGLKKDGSFRPRRYPFEAIPHGMKTNPTETRE